MSQENTDWSLSSVLFVVMFVNISSLNYTKINPLLEESFIIYGLTLTSNVLILVVGSFGNVLLLISSIGSGALGMDLVSTMLVEILAVSDILLIFTWYGPSLVTLVCRGWVLGAQMCFIIPTVQIAITAYEIFLISLLSVYRMWKLLRGFEAGRVSKRKVVNVSVALAVISVLLSGSIAVSGRTNYSPEHIGCYRYHKQDSPLVQMTGIVFIAIPMVLILVINLSLLYIVARSAARSGSSSKRTNIALISISFAFVLSYVLCVMVAFGFDCKSSAEFELLLTFFASINAVTTPIISFVTILNFRRHIMNSLGSLVSSTGPNHWDQGDQGDRDEIDQSI